MTTTGGDLIGQRLGACTIVAKLGAGAMGIVYRATHDEHGDVVVKTVMPEFQARGDMARRFKREAEAARRIDGRHVVRGYGLEEANGLQLLVQEFVPGGDVEGLIRKRGGRLDLADALRVARDVALGLASAHAAGLVHRDLKPGNVFLDEEGRGKIGDLGLVLQVDGEPIDGKTILTKKGQALGTPYFMAPEQWTGAHDVDARADLYALGVMIHAMLSGQFPFAGDSVSSLMKAHLTDAPLPLGSHLPSVPEPVESLVLRLLAKDREDRPAAAADVADEIGRIADALGIGAAVRGAAELDGTVIDAGTPVAAQPASDPATGSGAPSPGDAPPATAIAPAPGLPGVGETIGDRFRVEAILGQGGMGVVYRGRHQLLDEDFAVKLIHAELAARPEFRQRFLREARALMSFVHKGAVSLREFGEHEGSLYMAMDYVEGRTLGALLAEQGPFDQDRALELACQVLPCLEEAHAAGLVHRDLKPANLLVEDGGGALTIKILDFGIAKILEDDDAAATATLTGTGVSIGTPHYMSPEQDAGDPVDGRSDLYSFATLLYEALAGRKPLDAETARKLRYKIQMQAPDPLASAAAGRVTEAFADAVMAALAKDPDDRPAGPATWLASLEAAAAPARSTTTRPPTKARPKAAPTARAETWTVAAPANEPAAPPARERTRRRRDEEGPRRRRREEAGERAETHAPAAGSTLLKIALLGIGCLASVFVLAVVVAIAIPSLLSSRLEANETMAISSLRTITTCQYQFRESGRGPDGSFAFGTLDQLGEADLLDHELASGERSGYRFEVGFVDPETGAENRELAFTVMASPTEPDVTGTRWFYVDHEGVITESFDGPAGPYDPPIDGSPGREPVVVKPPDPVDEAEMRFRERVGLAERKALGTDEGDGKR